MVDGVARNLFLVNAPAGSGKTTWIRERVENYLWSNPDDCVLCITYTNRAAEELSKGLDGKRAYVGTIHSFISHFIGPFFTHKDIIDLYWDTYKEKIAERIANAGNKPEWNSSNDKYVTQYGKLDMETVRANIQEISYGEAPFTYYFGGALGHDDLISFARIVVDRFPVIKKKISEKYQLVFIDEYQDTAADVLHIFYESIIGTGSILFLLGDKMQQIYKNYNGEFEDQLRHYDRSYKLTTNYRTTPKIVEILNAIYNDDDLKQIAYVENSDDAMEFYPKVIITEDVEKCILALQKKYKDALILYVSNKARFVKIGAGGLFEAYRKMEKYKYGRKYTAVDVLTKPEARDNDALLSFFYLADQIIRDYKRGHYGEVLRFIRTNKKNLNSDKYCIRVHEDKEKTRSLLETVVKAYDDSSMTIDSFMGICKEKELLNADYYLAVVEDSDYQLAKSVRVQEIRLLFDYLEDPTVSTQHGVKGESHDTVVFVADNSRNPAVYMSEFFELWSRMSIKLSEFDDFYYRYRRLIKCIETEISCECSNLKKDTYKPVAAVIKTKIERFALENSTSEYYANLLKDKVDQYLNRPTFTNARECLKENTVYGPLCAYRLFYVGCSRARRNLVIIIKKTDIERFEKKLCEKLKDCGFEVQYSSALSCTD